MTVKRVAEEDLEHICASPVKKPRLSEPVRREGQEVGTLSVITWNIAAINNNPFEYWITHDDPEYVELMIRIEHFIDTPGDRDITLADVFAADGRRYAELRACMAAEGWEGLDAVDKMWTEDFSKRGIISGFLKDKTVGAKRLASMPDRITNTIRVADSTKPVCRPTVTNNFDGSLASVDEWWPKWRNFMFCQRLRVGTDGESKRPCELLDRISCKKYPAVTEEEERISVPLQTLCLALFDAVMVHIMNTVSPDGRWQTIKKAIVDSIFSNKDQNTVAIIRDEYSEADIVCLQECAASFRGTLQASLGASYHVAASADADQRRDQNSIILLRKTRFPLGTGEVVSDLTAEVMEELGDRAPVERGDIVAAEVQDSSGRVYVVASFHGDTNGLSGKLVVAAVVTVFQKRPPGSQLVFGLDANTHLRAVSGSQGVDDFLEHVGKAHGLRSCWPDGEPMSKCLTTCHARTFLQAQTNKAVRKADILVKGDLNPKDHILVQRASFQVKKCTKDNSGQRRYEEGACFPTLHFPSDHALVCATLMPIEAVASPAGESVASKL
eukprot:TRINITY_DN7468_c0_g3_i1.p1 TRINITY_DN7468_c0_g3~~TRINITY_DN7468_c0_g3_i1.p1  ORF type:complete len:585 (+),score=103.67 TRINITY_DN7468_c0_g3_i1:91-1755(+)